MDIPYLIFAPFATMVSRDASALIDSRITSSLLAAFIDVHDLVT
jgi:hypothetical protein